MKTSIKLIDLKFYAYHGVLPQEAAAGNDYVVNIEMTADLSNACESDNVDETINYASVYDIVKKEMNIPSKLLEHVAMRIYKSISGAFPQIEDLEVSVAKMNPPIQGEVKCAEVVIRK